MLTNTLENLDLSEKKRWIAFDTLGGDAPKSTEVVDGYAGDASVSNLEAWREFIVRNYAKIQQSEVGFVLVGRKEEVYEATRVALNQLEIEISGADGFLQVINSDRQAAMDGSDEGVGRSMEVIAELLRKPEIVTSYSNGATSSMVQLHAPQADLRNMGSPFIAKQLVPGVWAGDMGARLNQKTKDYIKMFRTLHAEAGKTRPKVSILPDDNLSEDFIRQKIQHFADENEMEAEFIEFDVLGFLGLRGEKPDIILSNGFVGNIYLKAIETFLKEKEHWKPLLSPFRRAKIMRNIVELDMSEESDFPLETGFTQQWQILANGTEEKKGTRFLQDLHAKCTNNLGENFGGYVEPEGVFDDEFRVLATPASAKVMKGFLQQSLIGQLCSHPKKAWDIKKQQKKAVGSANLMHIKGGEVIIGHGKALAEDTIKILQQQFDAHS